MILSLHGGHSASAAIVALQNGVLKNWCISSERIDRIKFSCGCEIYTGDDFSATVKSNWIKNYKTDLELIITELFKQCNVDDSDIEYIVLSQNTALERLPLTLRNKKIKYVSHHLAHAALSYYTSNFDNALTIVCDGEGEKHSNGFETQTAWSCEGTQIKQILGTHKKTTYDMGIGNAYELFTYWLGYGYGGAGTTMALASFYNGMPLDPEKIFVFDNKGNISLNTAFVDVATFIKKSGYKKEGTAAFNQAYEDVMRKLPLPHGYRLRNKGEVSIEPEFIRMAGDIQNALEVMVLRYLDYAHSLAPHNNICMSGGTFLNCNLNTLIREQSYVSNIYVPTAPGDEGLTLGAALYSYFNENKRCPVAYTPYVGSLIKKMAIDNNDTIMAEEQDDIYGYVAKLLADGYLVGWCQGRAELGPRALGHRSLLADPRRVDTPDKINSRLKHREPFRPFAPAVIEEVYHTCFEGSIPIPYMLETRKIKPEWRDKIPAVRHIDDSARVQVVNQKIAPEFHCLISRFNQITGVPILVNTSLNRNGEPIVNSGEDALKLLRADMMDFLVIENIVYSLKEKR